MTDRASRYTDVPVMTQEARAHNREAARGKGRGQEFGSVEDKRVTIPGTPRAQGRWQMYYF